MGIGPKARQASDQGPSDFGTSARGGWTVRRPSFRSANDPAESINQTTGCHLELEVRDMTRRNLTTTFMVVSAGLLLFGGVALAGEVQTREDRTNPAMATPTATATDNGAATSSPELGDDNGGSTASATRSATTAPARPRRPRPTTTAGPVAATEPMTPLARPRRPRPTTTAGPAAATEPMTPLARPRRPRPTTTAGPAAATEPMTPLARPRRPRPTTTAAAATVAKAATVVTAATTERPSAARGHQRRRRALWPAFFTSGSRIARGASIRG